MSFQIKNLTPHIVNILDKDDEIICTFPSQGNARCLLYRKQIDYINQIPINISYLGKVEGLPEPEEGIRYIVSVLVAQVENERKDLLIPDEVVRNNNGRIIGCRALAFI